MPGVLQQEDIPPDVLKQVMDGTWIIENKVFPPVKEEETWTEEELLKMKQELAWEKMMKEWKSKKSSDDDIEF